jgi:MFS family permease
VTTAAGAPPATEEGAVDWKRNVVALFVGQVAAMFGLSFTFPFIPLFLRNELHITDAHQLAVWSGVASAGLGVGLFVSGPVWGMVADRYGRKPMLMRAMLGGAITVLGMGLSTNVAELVIFRIAFGLLSGTTPVAIALAAAETPTERMPFALGWISAAGAFGTALGPAVSGAVAGFLGLRATYFVGAAIEACAVIPVLLLVRETRRPRHISGEPRRAGGWRDVRALGRHTMGIISLLLVVQALYLTVSGAMQPLLVLRIVALYTAAATVITGVAFTLSGAGTGFAAALYSRAAGRTGHRRAAVIATLLMAGAVIAMASGGSLFVILPAVTLFGIASGTLAPGIATMLSLETPVHIRATVFGFVQSATAVGLIVGPLLASAVAAASGPAAGLVAASGVALLATLTLAALGRLSRLS